VRPINGLLVHVMQLNGIDTKRNCYCLVQWVTFVYAFRTL